MEHRRVNNMMMTEESSPTELVFTIQSSPPFLLEIIIVVLQILFLAFPTHATMYYPHITQADIMAESAMLAESIRRSVSDVTEVSGGTTDDTQEWSLPRPRVGVAKRFKIAQDRESEVKINSGRHTYRRRRRRQDMMGEEDSIYKTPRPRYGSVPEATKACKAQARRRAFQQSLTPSRQNVAFEQPTCKPLRYMPYPPMVVSSQGYSDDFLDTSDDLGGDDGWLPLDDSQHDMTWIGQDMTEYSDRELIDDTSERIFQNEFLIQCTEPEIPDLPYDDDFSFNDQAGTYLDDSATERKFDYFRKSNTAIGNEIVPYMSGMILGRHTSRESVGGRSGSPLRGTVLIPKLLPDGSLGFICAQPDCSDYDEVEEQRENRESHLSSNGNATDQQTDIDTEDERELHMSENRSLVYGITERSRINRQTYVTKYGFLRQDQDEEETFVQKNKDKGPKGSVRFNIEEGRKKLARPEEKPVFPEKRSVNGKQTPSKAKKGNGKKTIKCSKPKGSDGKADKLDTAEDDEGVPGLITEEPLKAANSLNKDAVKKLLDNNPKSVQKDPEKNFFESAKSAKGGKRGLAHS